MIDDLEEDRGHQLGTAMVEVLSAHVGGADAVLVEEVDDGIEVGKFLEHSARLEGALGHGLSSEVLENNDEDGAALEARKVIDGGDVLA